MRLIMLAITMSSLVSCGEMPQRWTESEIREIAAEEAADAMPRGTADAALVEDAINELRDENIRLQNEIDNQQSEIDSLRAQIS